MSTKLDTARLLRINRVIKSNKLKFLGIYFADLLNIRYMIIRFDPIIACNLWCKMCYFSSSAWRKKNVGQFSEGEIKKIAQIFFPRALQLYIGCVAEPTVLRNYPSFIKLGSQYRVPFISLVSNGQLITENDIEKMIQYRLDVLTLSTHGVKPKTYESLMVNAHFDKFIKLLKALDRIKNKRNSKIPKLRINYTINPDNLYELKEFFNVYGDFNIDTIQFRPIMDYGPMVYKEKDFTPFVPDYNTIIEYMKKECINRHITLLYNTWNPTYSKRDDSSIVYNEAVARFIKPGRVWMEDYNYMYESYKAFCKRSGFRKRILNYILGKEKFKIKPSTRASSEVL
jgi:MoaA/NifB/PqqE/SkfB family radical SAM enzyme